MKNLGKIVFIGLLSILLYSNPLIVVNTLKEQYNLHEKFLVTVVITNYNKDKELFHIKPNNSDFAVNFLTLKEFHEKLEYKYWVEPKKSGNLNLAFECEIRGVNSDAIKESTVGLMSIKDLELSYVKKRINIGKQLTITQNQYKNFGNFSYDVNIDKNEVYQNEPVIITIELKGDGSLEEFDSFKIDAGDAQCLYGDLKKTIEYTETIKYLLKQQIACSGVNDFIIKPNEFAFDTKILSSQPFNISVKNADVVLDSLLDEEDKNNQYIDVFREYIPYILVFLIGVFIGKSLNIKWNIKRNNPKIKLPDEPKELLRIALTNDKLKNEIKELEEHIYNGKNINISQIKKNITLRCCNNDGLYT